VDSVINKCPLNLPTGLCFGEGVPEKCRYYDRDSGICYYSPERKLG
jgi:hypothetical protein